MVEKLIDRGGRQDRWMGGEMEMDPEMLCATAAGGVPWSFESCQTVTSGRTGIKLVAQMVMERSKGIGLLPAYLCSSMIQPFRELGVPVDFYKINSDLTIDLGDLLRLVETLRPSSLLFVNYFGFPVSQAEAATLREIKDRCWVIEDCVQGSLIEQEVPVVGGIGHFVITSFRKYLPVPDGGLVINRTDMALPHLPPPTGLFARYRLLGKLLRFEYMRNSLNLPELEAAYFALFAAGERELDTGAPLHAMSPLSERLLGMTDLSAAMTQRRRNYSFLLRAFAEEPQLKSIGVPVLTDLPSGVSPLVFPIRVAGGRRDVLRQKLVSLRAFCPAHWPWPSAIKAGRFPEAFRLSHQMLGLPIDQRYVEEDMESLIARLLRAWDEIDGGS